MNLACRAVLIFSVVAAITISCPAGEAPGQAETGVRPDGTTAVRPDGTNNAAMLGSISGRVATADNHPVGDARIEILDLNTGAMVASGYTQRNGLFEFHNLAPGEYQVVATVGLSESRERAQVSFGDTSLVLRVANTTEANEDPHHTTISVAELKVPDKARKALRKAQDDMARYKLDESRQEIAKALEIYPNYAEALGLRGIIELQQKRVDVAQADLEKAIQLDPNYAYGYFALGSTYNAEQHYDDAIRTLSRGLSLSPNSWQGYFELSRAYLGKGDFQKALQQANMAEVRAPREYPTVHLVKAHALLGLQSYTAAIAELEAYLSRDPEGPNSANARQALDKARAFAGKK